LNIARFNDKIARKLAVLETSNQLRLAASLQEIGGPIGFHYRADETYHAASTMKVPVMVEIFRLVGEKKLKLSDRVLVDPTCRSMIDDSPFTCDTKEYLTTRVGKKETVLRLVEEMIIHSDNLATNLLIALSRPQSITGTWRALGATTSYVLRGLSDELAYAAGISNRVTARDLSILMTAIATDRAASKSSCGRMREILLRQPYNTMIPALLPKELLVAHKTGTITRIAHDTATVYAPAGAYALTILCEEDKPRKTTHAKIAQLSRTIFDAWEELHG